MVRSHQPGESAFRSILPEDIVWKPFPAFPPRLDWPCWLETPLNRDLTSSGSRCRPV